VTVLGKRLSADSPRVSIGEHVEDVRYDGSP
jgi:hypothetical protein